MVSSLNDITSQILSNVNIINDAISIKIDELSDIESIDSIISETHSPHSSDISDTHIDQREQPLPTVFVTRITQDCSKGFIFYSFYHHPL